MSEGSSRAPLPEARILVVDDELRVRTSLARYLAMMGYSVESSASGEQALEMLDASAFDVAIVDIRLPGIDGVAVMQQALKVHPDLGVILLTAYASVDSALAAVRAGAVDYLRKPARALDIATAVSAALERRAHGMTRPTLCTSGRLRVGPVVLDPEKRVAVVVAPDGSLRTVAELSPSESALLAHLMQHPIVAIPCRELAAVLGYNISDRESRPIIRTHICRLRRKLKAAGGAHRLVQTAVGRGYVFRP